MCVTKHYMFDLVTILEILFKIDTEIIFFPPNLSTKSLYIFFDKKKN